MTIDTIAARNKRIKELEAQIADMKVHARAAWHSMNEGKLGYVTQSLKMLLDDDTHDGLRFQIERAEAAEARLVVEQEATARAIEDTKAVEARAERLADVVEACLPTMRARPLTYVEWKQIDNAFAAFRSPEPQPEAEPTEEHATALPAPRSKP